MKKTKKIKNGVMLAVAAALTLGVSQNVFAQNKTRTDEATQTTRDNEGTVVQDTSSTTTTTEEKEHVARGGFFLEPMLFASQEDQTIKSAQLAAAAGNSSTSSRGYGAGLRIGGHLSEIFLLGLDARYARVDAGNSYYRSEDANVYNIAPFIGAQTPFFGIRVLAGYVAAGENNPGSSKQGLDLKFKEAAGWRLGAGLHVGAVGINLEYQDLTYNRTEIEAYGQIAQNTDTNIDMQSKGYALSVSFPIQL